MSSTASVERRRWRARLTKDHLSEQGQCQESQKGGGGGGEPGRRPCSRPSLFPMPNQYLPFTFQRFVVAAGFCLVGTAMETVAPTTGLLKSFDWLMLLCNPPHLKNLYH